MKPAPADFQETILRVSPDLLYLQKLETLQVNLGNLCNQACRHCHVTAGPKGKNLMSRAVLDTIIAFLRRQPDLILDITGGAPELHPDFKYFISQTSHSTARRIVRTNLTVIMKDNMQWLPEFFRDHGVVLAASLPSYTREKVDDQRGCGVFDRSIAALKKLNDVGYGDRLELDIVYNPSGPCLPSSQKDLEQQFKARLSEDFGIRFNNLFAITNTPVGRFANELKAQNRYEEYIALLSSNFHPGPAEHIMCRTLISVDWQGNLYNCDFNQAQGLPLRKDGSQTMTVDDLATLMSNPPAIITGTHCFACTASYGSSCTGELDAQTAATHDKVKQYYGIELKSTRDLKTSACCSIDALPPYRQNILKMIAPEIRDRFYGCGSPIPPCLEGSVVVDLGCGTGRDAFTASYLTGPQGFVIGVDMTREQLNVGRRHLMAQMKTFGFDKANVDLRFGNIENLRGVDIDDNSVDVVISNCVINLSPDKHAVFKEIFRILKPGGELYFSDVFADRRVPYHLVADPVLYGECLGGAMYIEDFRRMLCDAGCPDYRVISKRAISLDNPEIRQKAGMIDFFSMTIRAFKLEGLEDICEDYGQTATYLGSIAESCCGFQLDDHHLFQAGKAVPVCGNTASILQQTRYARHFRVTGDRCTHYGPFDCTCNGPLQQKSTNGSCC